MIFPVMTTAEEIKEGDTLTLDRCIETALAKNQSIAASESTVNANKYKLDQTRSNYYPQVGLFAGYSMLSQVSGAPRAASGSFNEYSSSITLKQNIFDFGRTAAQVRIQKYTLESSRTDLEGTIDQIVFNVKQAYYGVLQAKRTVDVASETVHQFEQHLKQAQEEASQAAMQLAQKEYYPSLSGNASYDLTGENFPPSSSWSVGVALSFSIFSGFSTKGRIGEAQSNLSVLNAKKVSLRQQILLDINQAYVLLQESQDSVRTAKLIVQQAEENLALANGRYVAGVGSPIEVTDVLVTYTNAKASYIGAQYNYKIARASIEKAMGAR